MIRLIILLLGGPVVLLLKSVHNRNVTVSAHNQEPISHEQMHKILEGWTKQHISVHLFYVKKQCTSTAKQVGTKKKEVTFMFIYLALRAFSTNTFLKKGPCDPLNIR